MNELRKDGTEKIILLFPAAVHGPTPDVGSKGYASGFDAINHGHHFARDKALGYGPGMFGCLYYHMRD
jgi:hypothetical protein